MVLLLCFIGTLTPRHAVERLFYSVWSCCLSQTTPWRQVRSRLTLSNVTNGAIWFRQMHQLLFSLSAQIPPCPDAVRSLETHLPQTPTNLLSSRQTGRHCYANLGRASDALFYRPRQFPLHSAVYLMSKMLPSLVLLSFHSTSPHTQYSTKLVFSPLTVAKNASISYVGLRLHGFRSTPTPMRWLSCSRATIISNVKELAVYRQTSKTSACDT